MWEHSCGGDLGEGSLDFLAPIEPGFFAAQKRRLAGKKREYEQEGRQPREGGKFRRRGGSGHIAGRKKEMPRSEPKIKIKK